METPSFLYGTAWKEDDTRRCVEDALRAGFRGIDTANQRKHYFEAAVGEGIAGSGVKRAELFLQTKFTFLRGQDHRLPYDPEAPIARRVEQSFASSLENLGTEYLDSYVLHGPSVARGLVDDDWEAWGAMEKLKREGKARFLGVSNVSLGQLKLLCERASVKPSFVQNRCYASRIWDQDVRKYCRENGIRYQGFSLLTANSEIFRDQRFVEIIERNGCTPAQAVFAFSIQIGMLPLTGTTDPEHMEEDLAAADLQLSGADVRTIESLCL